MSKQPEALQLADELDKRRRSLYAMYLVETDTDPVAAELRRLHAVNQELLAALKEAHACILGDHWGNALDVLAYEINKAERTTP